MSLTPTQAQLLDELATRALDALRDQDRAAVELATELHPTDRQREHHRRMAARAQDAELQLHDTIAALVEHPKRQTNGRLQERLTAYLGKPS